MVVASDDRLALYIYCSVCNMWRQPDERGHSTTFHHRFSWGKSHQCCLPVNHMAYVMYCKLTRELGHPTHGMSPQVDGYVEIPDEVIIEPVVDDGLESEAGFEAVIVDGLDGGAGAEDFVPDAVIVDGQGGDGDSEFEFDFEVAEGRGVGANNAVIGAENMPPANHIVPDGNGRPRHSGLSVIDYNENNRDLDVVIGAESPRKSGPKRRRQI